MQNTNLVGRAENAVVDYATAQKQEAEDMDSLDERLKNLTSKVNDITGGNGGADKTQIDDTEHIKYYADVDDNGTVDGIIFADLAVGSSGQWGDEDGAYSYEAGVKGTPPGYYIKEENHTEQELWDKQPHDVIAPINTGYDRTSNYRFYVMELKDREGQDKSEQTTTKFCWYDAADDEEIPDYNTITSEDFGTGRSNTATMLSKWKQGDGAYGARNDNGTYNDLWSLFEEEKLEWFLPSSAEWSCFVKKFEIDASKYNDDFGLSKAYWTSSLPEATNAWAAHFDEGYIERKRL